MPVWARTDGIDGTPVAGETMDSYTDIVRVRKKGGKKRISKRSGPGPAWELLNAWVALVPSYADLNRLAL